jgi:hypothetical protein
MYQGDSQPGATLFLCHQFQPGSACDPPVKQTLNSIRSIVYRSRGAYRMPREARD